MHVIRLLAHQLTVVPSSKNVSTATMKTSIDPKPSSAYSEDLRLRMVWQREALGYTYE